ncbi:protein of unknown function (L domain-like) [endosymbiont DhMRE of Dentiscutata heterogama]|uniref:hypothetical protein n=1 Tax=endosymbiont DhMRE of Dentiscutata heterogama TaxID=1609546 RepID=UPI000629DAE2|nr:hypothetical protein [endosymbiont DhMRE of Dentiscutata heterogama]CFW92861.1 protein of unknown function (L domain-like) [endosymbiont DhMRE of Dentiscutata heterogama]
MADKDIQQYLKDNYDPSGGNKIIKIDDSKKTAPTDKLTGKGVIEGYPDLETIDLKGNNEIEELIIRNCPKLKKIDVNENKKLKTLKFDDMVLNGDNQLETLLCINCEEIEELSLKTCKHLKTLNINNCKKLNKIKGIEDVDSIDELKARGVPKIRFIHSDKLDGFIEAKDALKELLGLSPNDKLPDSVRNNGKIDKDKLKNELTSKVAGSANSEKDQAKQEAQTAKAELTTAKAEKTNLESQLNAIKTELGVGNNANQQQIIAKIKELMGRPASTDYNTIKAERDNLKTEKDTLKTENTRLKNDNKENVNPNTLRNNTKTNLEKWGIKMSEEQKKTLQNATSSQKVEEVRNSIISGEINKLRSENSSSTKLSIGLGVVTICSLLLLGWVLMRQADLPEEGPKKEEK